MPAGDLPTLIFEVILFLYISRIEI